jgi:hypothetical protein
MLQITELAKILSANGSKSSPIFDVEFVFLAMYPSKKSLAAPIIKIMRAKIFRPFEIQTTNSGEIKILDALIALGKIERHLLLSNDLCVTEEKLNLREGSFRGIRAMTAFINRAVSRLNSGRRPGPGSTLVSAG